MLISLFWHKYAFENHIFAAKLRKKCTFANILVEKGYIYEETEILP